LGSTSEVLAMSSNGSTILDMPAKKSSSKKGSRKSAAGRPATGRTPTTTLFARGPPELGEALDAYLDSLRPQPRPTAVVRVALEEYLRSKGFWPWPPPGPSTPP